MHAKPIIRVLVLAGALCLVPAHADFHFMKIVEVFPGTAVAPDAQYVVLQMYAPGQQFVDNHALTVFAANGTQVASFQFDHNVGNGANQARILLATPEAEDFFGLQADLEMSAVLPPGGGKVCFAGTVDCVAWGGWSGSAAGVGTPFNGGAGLLAGRAAVRRLDIAGSASTLEESDDTDDCANDFAHGLPAPRNNAGQVGSVPASTCGNDAIEALEQCDDGNEADGDGCSSVCALENAGLAVAGDDYDGDGESDVFWRHTGNGMNSIWLSARSGTRQAVARVQSQDWLLAGVGDFNGDGEHDIFWRHAVSGLNSIWRSGRSGTRQPTIRVASQDWRIVGVADFDGDGRDDVFWRHSETGRNTVWRSGRSATRLPVAVLADVDWVVAGAGDYNGDGDADVLWRHTGDGRNMVWPSADAAGSTSLAGVTDQQWHVAGTGDFDGDGAADVLWRHLGDGRNTIWLAANASTQQPTTAVTDLDWIVADTGDFDGDGHDDVLWRHMGDGRNVIWKSALLSTQQAVTRVGNLAWIVLPDDGQVPPESAGPPLPSLSIADESVTEGDGGETVVEFTVQLSAAAAAAVSFDIATSDLSAVAGADYEAKALSDQVIPPGLTSFGFTVIVNGDDEVEDTEYFNVRVTNVAGATVARSLARGNIHDDDGDGY